MTNRAQAMKTTVNGMSTYFHFAFISAPEKCTGLWVGDIQRVDSDKSAKQ
jgi:hypothetical protein